MIATFMTGHRSAGKIETKDRRGREGGIAIFSELKIADFSGLCVASLKGIYFCIQISRFEFHNIPNKGGSLTRAHPHCVIID